MASPVLRWNLLNKRAKALGVDVQTLIGIDATLQRDASPPNADEQRKESSPATPE